FSAGSGRDDHTFTDSEFHGPGGEVGDNNDELADQVGGVVCGFDSGKDSPGVSSAETEGELDEFACLGDFGGGDDAGDAEVDLEKVVDADRVGEGRGGECVSRIVRGRRDSGGGSE